MRRECAGGCGNTTLSWRHSLCTLCYSEYGPRRYRWPDWLLFRAKDVQREIDADRLHDEFELREEYSPMRADWELTYEHYQMTSHGEEIAEIEDNIKQDSLMSAGVE